VQRTEDRQNLRFEGVFRNAHSASAPKTRGVVRWFQRSCGVPVRATGWVQTTEWLRNGTVGGL
jgi:hypothetical protein